MLFIENVGEERCGVVVKIVEPFGGLLFFSLWILVFTVSVDAL